jgi:hypothetical protein
LPARGIAGNIVAIPAIVPNNNYLASAFNSATTFVAAGTNQTLYDNFMSSATIIYRCVPAVFGAPAVCSVRTVGANTCVEFGSRTNQVYDVDYQCGGTGTWTNLMSSLAGTGGTLTVTNFGVGSSGQGFYRVSMTP